MKKLPTSLEKQSFDPEGNWKQVIFCEENKCYSTGEKN